MAETKAVEVKQKKRFGLNNTAILFIILAVMFAIASYVGRPFFFSQLNLIPMLNNLSFIGIVASVLTMLMISGEIDFSIGGNIGLTACLMQFYWKMDYRDGWL